MYTASLLSSKTKIMILQRKKNGLFELGTCEKRNLDFVLCSGVLDWPLLILL